MKRVVCTVKGLKRAHEGSREVVSLRKHGGGPNLISKRVRVLDANCSWHSTQGDPEEINYDNEVNDYISNIYADNLKSALRKIGIIFSPKRRRWMRGI